MDGLKLYAGNDDAFGGLLMTLKRFSDDIFRDFGTSNCIQATFKLRMLISIKYIILHVDSEIKKIDRGKYLQYLDVIAVKGRQHLKMKEISEKQE